DRWVKIPSRALDHRRFWGAMGALEPAELTEIERRVGEGVTGEAGPDLPPPGVGMTKFPTLLDPGDEEGPNAPPGKDQQKRNDLRLAGLALVVTRDGGVPVVSHAYPGSKPDVTQFTDVIDELVTRYRELAGVTDELTVVFDAGNNSAANQDHLAAIPGLHFVGSLVVSQHPDLLAIPASRYQVVDQARFGG